MNSRGYLHKGTFSIILAGSLAFSSITVLAETDLYQAVDGYQIAEEQLTDQTIEYNEIGSLIHTYNVDVQNKESNTENQRKEYSEIKNNLSWEKTSANSNKDEAKDDGDMESYAENASYEAIYKSAIKSYNKMLDRLDKYSTNKDRIALEKQLTSAAQSLMISYQSNSLQKDYLKKMEDLTKRLYENTKTQQQAGLATGQDVITAYNSWTNASISLNSMASNEDSVYQNLCKLLGVNEGGSIELKSVPKADLQEIAEINLEEDTEKAIGNNSDIIEQRNTSAGTTSEINKKNRTLQELEEEVTVKMKELYDEIKQAKTAYDAANAGYSSAQLTWDNAKNKYGMGMLSGAEYLQEELKFTQKETGFESADLELFQALETYKWAVKGIVSLD